jgi:hypothetical protein
MVDALKDLQPSYWKSGNRDAVHFPLSSCKTSFDHDMAEHRYFGVDGAELEPTGRAPLVFQCTIPFIEGISPGPKEKWTNLYPYGYRYFLSATADRARGLFNHPELGEIACRVKSFDSELNPSGRGGQIVNVTFVETRVPGDQPGAYDDTFDVQGVAANLNASAANLKLLLPKKEQEDFDWEKAIREIQSIGDRVTVASARAKGKISNVLARVNAVQDSFDRARDSSTDVDFARRTAQIVNHTVLREVEKVGAAASAAQKILNQQRRVVNVYLTTSVASLASIAVTLAVPIDDLISLNSAAARSYEVPRGFPIRYYSKVSR